MDAFKKTQKSKEAAKNKKSRDFQREAIAQLYVIIMSYMWNPTWHTKKAMMIS